MSWRWDKWRGDRGLPLRSPSGGLSRRAFLGGGAVALTLPLLPSLLPRGLARAAERGEAPRRLFFYYVPNGFHMPAWTPSVEGSDFDLPTILAPLQAHREELLVLSGLSNAPARYPGVPGDHARGTGAFLTCRRPYLTEGADIENGISVDQVAAEVIGKESLFASLQLGIAGGVSTGNCDSGYSCAYARNISWAGPASPLPKMTNVQLVFDRLFEGFDTTMSEEERERRKFYRGSILDQVLADAERLHARLGRTDQLKVDEYLTGVRELEQRIELPVESVCAPGLRPEEDSDYSLEEKVQLMSDLAVLAMQCDLTRVASFMLGNGGSGQTFDFLGVQGGHHEISHHQNDPADFERLTTIGTWEVEQLAYLLDRMAEVDELGTSLLDSSLVFFSSEIADGNAHGHFDLPVVLAGRGGGAVSPGRHVAYADDPPVADLFISMLDAVGVSVDSFGEEGTGPLPQLL